MVVADAPYDGAYPFKRALAASQLLVKSSVHLWRKSCRGDASKSATRCEAFKVRREKTAGRKVK